ncbi:MAG: hypothetical protein KKA07_10170 [Bacteroidetes bacterium]|nr:hypothetical protein [Bacteroidota bacterium]
MRHLFAIFICVCSCCSLSSAQSVYYSQAGSQLFSDLSNWNTNPGGGGANPNAADLTNGASTFIVQDGNTVILDISNADVLALQIGTGATGFFTLGNSTSATGITVRNNFTVNNGATVNVAAFNTTHVLNLKSNFINNGTVDLQNSISQVADVTFSPSSSASISGSSTAKFNNIIFGSGTVSASSSINVDGSVIIESGATFNDGGLLHTVKENWIDNGGIHSGIGTIDFDGDFVQQIPNVAEFYNVTFSNSGSVMLPTNLTVSGNFSVSGTKSVSTDANHTISGNLSIGAGCSLVGTAGYFYFNSASSQTIAIDPASSALFYSIYMNNGGSVNPKTIVGNATIRGTLYVYNAAEVTGTGTNTIANLRMDGVCSFSGAINFSGGTIYDRIDDDLTLGTASVQILGATNIEAGDLVRVNNNFDVCCGNFTINNGSELRQLVGGKTFHLADSRILTILGVNNFPNNFSTITLDSLSETRYNATFDQTVRGNITYGQLEVSNLSTKQVSGPIVVKYLLDLNSDAALDLQNFNHYISGNTTNGSGCSLTSSYPGKVTFCKQNGNQYINAGTGLYLFNDLEFTCDAPTAISTKFILQDIFVSGDFIASSHGDSAVTYTIIDINDIAINGSGVGNFSLGSNVHLYVSGASNFADAMNSGFAGKSFAQSSVVRFDGTGDQQIPSGFQFGSIELSQSSNKTALGNLDVNGYFRRIGGTPVFMAGGFSHTIAGDWLMSQTYATTVSTNSSTITFDGANQNISASCFGNVVFSGSGTKYIKGALDISNDLTIGNGVAVDAYEQNIFIEGDWTQTGTGRFTQTETTTTFDGTAGDQTISIATPATSYFGNLTISKNTSTFLIAGTDFYVSRAFLYIANLAKFNLNGNTVYIGGNYDYRDGCVFTPAAGTVVFNGTTINQSIYNRTAAASALDFYNLNFSGNSTKTFVVTNAGSYMNVDGNFNNTSTFNGSNYPIYVAGNWTNTGSFQHNNKVVFDGGNQNVGTSMFHDVEFAGTNVKTLTGPIVLYGWLQIDVGSTLDVGSNNAISLDENWYNNLGGTFTAREGLVTFNGANAYIYTGGVAASQQFYNVVVAKNSGSWASIPSGQGGMDINNDLTIQSGTFTTGDNNINIGGALLNGGIFNHNSNSSMLTFDATSGIHSIQSNEDWFRNITIDAPGAELILESTRLRVYRLCNLEVKNGKLSTNGKRIVFGDNASVGAGDIIVRAGATFEVDAGGSINFNGRNGEIHNYGELFVVGESGNPALMESMQSNAAYFYELINYSGSTIHANYYSLIKTGFNGVEVQPGATINATNNFSNGQFSSGGGTAYITLTGVDLGAGITATSLSFGSGPTYNVERTSGNGAITFQNSSGIFTGEAFDHDDANPGTKIIWTFPDGFFWDGGDVTDNTDWNQPLNWAGNTVPDANAAVFLEHSTGGVSGVYTVNIKSANALSKILTLDSEGGSAIHLVINGYTLNVAQDIIIGAGTSVTQTLATDTIRVAGNWQELGSYTPNTGTVLFNGTGGSSNIQALSSFNNIVLNASGQTYNLARNTDVNGDIRIWKGTLAAGAYNITVAGSWVVTNGTFDPGSATVIFDKGGTFTQTISGGSFFNFTTSNTGGGNGTRQLLSDMVVQNDVNIGANTVFDGSTYTIAVSRNWINNVGNAGFTQSGQGAVSFAGANQTIGYGGLATTFNNVNLNGTGTKTVGRDMNLNGSLTNNNVRLNIGADYVIDGIGGTNSLTMNNGSIYVYGASNLFASKGVNHNFPLNFENISLGGGTVYYQSDLNQDVFPTTYYSLDLRRTTTIDQTKTLLGNITVSGNLTIYDVSTELNVNDFTIYLTGNLYFPTGGRAIDWGSVAPDCDGTLQHEGGSWNIDVDISEFNNLILTGTGDKAMLNNLTITGDVSVLNGVDLWMCATNWSNPRTMVCTSSGKTFSLVGSSRLLNATESSTDVAFPSGFDFYSLDVSSVVYLDRAASQTIFTNGGTLIYGNLTVYTNGTATCDGILNVDGDFLMDNDAVLADGGHNLYFGGANCDLRGYPAPTSTTTFDGAAQNIRNDDSGTNPDDLYFKNIVFTGSGVKTFTNSQDVVYVSGSLTVNPGVTVDCNGTVSDIHFTGANWINNGTFNKLYATVFFEGTDIQTIDPGANHSFYAVTFSNGAPNAKTITTNPLNIEDGDFTINAGATVDFGTLSHTIASANVTNGGTWTTNNANLSFDRSAGNQNICGFSANNVVITSSGIARSKILTGNWSANDLTIESNSILDANSTGNYSITLIGNWTNNGGIFYSRSGVVLFEGDDASAKSIQSNASNFFDLSFNQALTGVRTYSMSDNFGVNGNITIGNGATLSLSGHTLTLGDNTGFETHTIQSGGTLFAGAGSTIAVNTYAGNAPIVVNGTLKTVGTSGSNASIDRAYGSYRIAITVDAGGTIAADYYHFKYLVDEGMVITSSGNIDDTYNLSNGTWSEMNTAGTQKRFYLDAECDPPSTSIDDVTFNYSATPVASRHYNVRRRTASDPLVFGGIVSGALGSENWEADGPGEAVVTPGLIVWPAISEVEWNGAVSTDWFNPLNWTPNVVPTNLIDAKIPLKTRNPNLTGSDAECKNLRLTNGMLRLFDGFDLTVNGDVIIGESGGSAVLGVFDANSMITVSGSWTRSAGASFVSGEGSVKFVAATGTASITPGTDPFYNIEFDGGATFNISGSSIYIDNDFVIAAGNISMATTNYNLYISGDFDNLAGTFINTVVGTVTFDGAAQSITSGTFYNCIIGGTDVKTAYQSLSMANTLTINSSLVADNASGCSIDMNGDVTINPTASFVDGSQVHYFAGRNWYGSGTYSGSGTVLFDRSNTNTVTIHESQFNNLTLSCNGAVYLNGDVDVTGDVTVNDSINGFYLSTFLLHSSNGLGTFSLKNNEILDVRGADNFPDNFGTYALDTNTFTRYYGTIDQTIAGVGYGNLQLQNAVTKTLDGNIVIKGALTISNSVLDVSSGGNYKISLAGDWNNNSSGSFLCRTGQVLFNGNANQTIRNNGTGTQTFYQVSVDKGGGSTATLSTHTTITDYLRVLNGVFYTRDYVVTIGSDLLCTGGTILTTSSANSKFVFNKASGSASIATNGSVFRCIDIDAGSTTYTLEDGLIAEMNFNLISGTFDGNGKIVEMSNSGYAATISGTYKIGNDGTLKIGNNATFTVNSGGSFYAVGTPGVAKITNRAGVQRYTFVVDGTIYAEDYLFEYMATGGIRISASGSVDLTNNFSNGTFSNGASGGTYLTFENTQTINGANRIENVSFNYNPLGGATNVTKTAESSGEVEFYNSAGVFAGENFDNDPYNIITWSGSVTLSWIGLVSTDWFNTGNWSASSGSPRVPLISDDVIINSGGSIIFQPRILQAGAVAKSIRINSGGNLSISTPVDDANDLEIAGDLNNYGTISCGSANDTILVGGNWTNQTGGTFTPSSGTVIFNNSSGTYSLTPYGSHFYNLVIQSGGVIQLAGNLLIESDLVIESGTFDVSTSNYGITLAGSFLNTGTFLARAGRLTLTAASGTEIIQSGNSNLNELYLSAGIAAIYQLDTDNLTVDNNLTINSGKLDLNGKDLGFGNSSGDVLNVSGILNIGANSSLKMAASSSLQVASGGKFYIKGTGESAIASLTNQGLGDYSVVVSSGATIYARYYLIDHVNASGIQIRNGATIDGTDNFSDGAFSNGSGRYLLIENLTADFDPVNNVTFNSGASVNVRAVSVSGNYINFVDPSGARAGVVYEDDDGGASTGAVRWVFTNPILVWDGSEGTDWNDADNWSDQGTPGVNLFGTPPTALVHAIIPNASTTPNDPVLGSGSDGICMNLTIESDGLLTLSNLKNLQVDTLLLIEGTLTVSSGSASTISTRRWENTGTFNRGASTVYLRGGRGSYNIVNGTANGAFNNLTINNSLTNDTATYLTSSTIEINGNLTINGGTFIVKSSSHNVLLAGNFVNTDGRSGKFYCSNSLFRMDGTNQSFSSYMTETLGQFSVINSGTKTINSNIQVNTNLGITTPATLANNATIQVNGNWSCTGTYTAGLASSVQFAGTSMQSITAGAGLVFYNLEINNAAGVLLDVSVSCALLYLHSGKITTSSSDLITVSGTASDAISIGTGYVNGPIARTLPAGMVAGQTYIFPTGKASYKPVALVDPITEVTGTVVVRAEVFDADFGGTPDASLCELSDNRYWVLSITAGASNFASSAIRLTETGLESESLIGKTTVPAGMVSSIGGEVSGNEITSETITALGYFVIGRLGPEIQFITGGGSYCPVDGGLEVGLDNSVVGTTYQLQIEGEDIGSPVVGTGSAITFGLQIDAGDYTAQAFLTANPGCYALMSGTATVVISNALWNGSADSDWATSANWTSCQPDENTDVEIPSGTPASPEISGSALCKTLDIQESATLDVLPGGALTLSGALNVDGTMNILSPSSTDPAGSMIDNGTINVGVTGEVNVYRYLAGNRWWYVGSPVAGQKSSVYDAADAGNKIYYWEEASGSWIRINNNTTNLDDAIGYSVKFPVNTMLHHQGTPNTGSLLKNLARTHGAVKEGFELLANPYPSSVDWDATSGWTKTNLESNTIWFRSDGIYCTYNGNTGVGVPEGTTGIIPQAQAFWVRVDSSKTSGQVVMNNEVRVHNSVNFYKSNKSGGTAVVRLLISGNGNTDEAVVAVLDNAKTGFDKYDSEKMLASDASIPQISTRYSSKSLTINSIPSVPATLPLGIKSGASTTYAISLKSVINLDPSIQIYLEDISLGIIQDLTSNPVYTFAIGSGTFNNRFKIHFNASPLPVELLGFSTQCEGAIALIDWETATESSCRSFLVQRSADGIHFSTLAEVPGAGNSNTLKKYSVSDSLECDAPVYYRLKQIDFDGNSNYSTAIIHQCCDLNESGKPVSRPWYFEDGVSFELNMQNNTTAKYILYNENGAMVKSGKISSVESSFFVAGTDFPAGIYFLSFEIAGEVVPRKFLLK